MKTIQNLKFNIQKFDTCILAFIVIASINVIAASSAYAMGGGGGEHHFTWKDWLWPIVNFAILLFVLVKFGRKPIKDFFKNRTEMIAKSLAEAQEAKELAQRTLDEVRERLKNTDKELEQILDSARKAGEKEKETMIAEGLRIKEKILEQTKANIAFELQKAKETIKSDAALLALELAETKIKDKLGPKEQEGLIDDYIKRLEANN